MIPDEVAKVRDILREVWGVTEAKALEMAWRIYRIFDAPGTTSERGK